MALECAHCGARVDDGAARCPQCLRATGLVAAADPPARRADPRRVVAWLTGALALLAVAGAVVALVVARGRRRGDGVAAATAGLRGITPADVPPVFDTGAALAPLVARVRADRAPLAQARAVLDAIAA